MRKYISRTARLVAAAAALAVGSVVVPTAGAAPESERPEVGWKACPSYSDDVLRQLYGGDNARIARQLWARAECGTVSVPLDYDEPDGRQITVAVTRLKAVDQQHRLGSLALNPGGPGGSGYLMPFEVVMQSPTDRQLNDRYDLIGFDPRGVGYSTKIDCPALPKAGGRPQPGPVTEAMARQAYADQLRGNQACSTYDPAFLRGLTTANMARDLDRVRAALHEHKINFMGVSWGTWLGALYRSLFPGKVDRMWLDSTTNPDTRSDTFVQGEAAAAARDFARMASWIAGHNATYGFGTTGEQVEAALAELERSYDSNPRTFTDLPATLDGGVVGSIAAGTSPSWPLAAELLKELRDATGPAAPPTVKQVLGGGGSTQPPPPGMPEQQNSTMSLAVTCNEDTGPRDFDSAWAAYQRRLVDFPVTGRVTPFTPGCQGWTLPPAPTRLRQDGGSLVMSGHRYESRTPYEWTIQMHEAIGGTVFTVDDDVHGSLLRVPECAAHLVAYFETGSPGASGCQGVPGPQAPAPTASAN